jgi:hypothetical protein
MRRVLFSVVVAVVAATSVGARAPDAYIGRWQLSIAKSQLSYEPPQRHLESIEAVAEGVKFTREIVTATGRKQADEIVSRMDGADVRVAGGAPNNTRAYKRIDERTYELVVRSDGKVSLVNRVVVSPDGATRTQTQWQGSATGTPSNVLVFERR